ncbi:IS66 family insertion sequence element accessory protein TnpB [Alicyclobacillus sp. ALC3]|uniref:IS66 family insertion sequence element accessory protein TnpB n=1 Tax=Alicyclobacillus sp. ALC3 TaxID=2796143 RepID=UPI0027A5B1D0|nr:IS66 family insertion sequence element accessory protein TnpB [Alicyclobacillus sp. ALC3]
MLNELTAEQRVYLATGYTDMRKSIDGLAILVQQGFELDPFSPCVFVFCNRQRDKVKILQLLRRHNNESYISTLVSWP